MNSLVQQHSTGFSLPAESIPQVIPEKVTTAEWQRLQQRIPQLLAEKNALLVAHYYTDERLQRLAEDTGGCVSDSLEMARFGYHSSADTLVVCGVRFMGETAKILNPEKQVLMLDAQATCSLDMGCPVESFRTFCETHPDHTVVVYANTSAAVKACADWMVTSGSAVPVVRHLQKQQQPVLWAPDKYLGEYVQEQTGADMLLWQASCVVHEEFKSKELALLKQQHPEATVLVHPESPAGVIALADVVASTTGIIQAACQSDKKKFIVATDKGIFYQLRRQAPDKTFIEAPTAGHSATCISCAHCPWMAMNSVSKLEQVLLTGSNEIQITADIRERALLPVKRLLEFTAEQPHLSAGDA